MKKVVKKWVPKRTVSEVVQELLVLMELCIIQWVLPQWFTLGMMLGG